MKIATVLSVSALLASFSVVACSSPTTPADSGDKSDSADSKSDDSKKSSSSSQSSPSNTASKGTSTTNGTSTTTPADATGSDAACTSCLAEDPTMKKVLDCQAKCSETDDACFGKCASDNGCAENNASNACATQFNKCADKCAAPPPNNTEVQACETCLSGQNNAQVNAIEKCFADAKDQASAQKCDAMQCDAACDSAYKACDSKCGFGG